MEFTAEQVWGLAVAADRINGGYLKEDVWDFKIDEKNPIKRCNKAMIKTWLREGTLAVATEEDVARGIEYRNHFKSYVLLSMAGKLNSFQETAMKLAAKDVFTGRDMYDFAVVGCLPEVARRDQARTELKREVYASEQLAGAVGDTIVSEIAVVNCRFNPNYNKHRVTARIGESFVDFWVSRPMEGTLRIKGKIKGFREDKTAQLHYVKVL